MLTPPPPPLLWFFSVQQYVMPWENYLRKLVLTEILGSTAHPCVLLQLFKGKMKILENLRLELDGSRRDHITIENKIAKQEAKASEVDAKHTTHIQSKDASVAGITTLLSLLLWLTCSLQVHHVQPEMAWKSCSAKMSWQSQTQNFLHRPLF